MRQWTRRLLMILAAVTMLGGCGGPEDTVTSPTLSKSSPTVGAASTSSAVAASPSPPSLPEAATHNDEAGQVAFIQHWWDLYNFAYQTGDSDPLMAVSEPGQPGTTALSKEIAKMHAAGKHLEGGRYRVIETVPVPLDELGTGAPTVTVEKEPGEIVGRDGYRETTPAESPSSLGMSLYWADGRWTMFGLGTL